MERHKNNVSDSKEGLKSLSHDLSKEVVFKSTAKESEKLGGAENNVAAPKKGMKSLSQDLQGCAHLPYSQVVPSFHCLMIDAHMRPSSKLFFIFGDRCAHVAVILAFLIL